MSQWHLANATQKDSHLTVDFHLHNMGIEECVYNANACIIISFVGVMPFILLSTLTVW